MGTEGREQNLWPVKATCIGEALLHTIPLDVLDLSTCFDDLVLRRKLVISPPTIDTSDRAKAEKAKQSVERQRHIFSEFNRAAERALAANEKLWKTRKPVRIYHAHIVDPVIRKLAR